ncbi:MAG: nuclear transport factor 2 family protein [Pyrinomonadaceae bacterium]
MRSKTLFILGVMAAALMAGCGGPAANAPAANSLANTVSGDSAKPLDPLVGPPPPEVLFTFEKQANEAYIKGDAKFFETILSDQFVMNAGGQRMGKADVAKMIGGTKCTVKEGWTLDKPETARINDDTYVITYTSNVQGSCTFDGHTEKMDKPVRAATVWIRNDDKWQPVFHGENPIVDPKAHAAPPAKTAAKKEDPMKDHPMSADSKAADAKTDAPKPDGNTDALVKIHQSGWEAFKAKDAKKFEEITTKDMSFIDPMGMWTTGQANVIKVWTEMKCDGITQVAVSDGFASAISPTAEILTVKGTSDGTCMGQKNGDLWQTAVYVKEGETWKLGFMFESAGM